MLGRRKFLGTLTAGVVTTLVTPGIIKAAAITDGHASLRDQFVRLVGSNFRLVDATGTTTIARLAALDDGPESPGLEQFSIVFEGADLTDGLYRVYHRRTGGLRISFMPSGEPGPDLNRQRAHFSSFT